MSELAGQGTGIVMACPSSPELLAMCDSRSSCWRRAVTAELSRGEATQERIMEAATSGCRWRRRDRPRRHDVVPAVVARAAVVAVVARRQRRRAWSVPVALPERFGLVAILIVSTHRSPAREHGQNVFLTSRNLFNIVRFASRTGSSPSA